MATTETIPAGVKFKGYGKLAWLATLASATAVSLATDITTGNCLNISFAVNPSFTPALAQNTGVDDRYGTVQPGQTLGNKSWTFDNFTYIDDPQGTTSTTPKGKLLENAAGFFLWRPGLLATVDWAATQLVYVFPAVLGGRVPVGTSADEFGKWTYQQQVAIGLGVLENIAIAS